MARIGQKLHSRRGATILLALLLTLVAAMVSAVILSAAVTAAKRVRDDRTQEQDYLSASSAGKLFAAYLKENRKYEIQRDYQRRATDAADYPGELISSREFDVSGELDAPVFLKRIVEKLNDPSYTHTLSLDAPEGMREAEMRFTVRKPENADYYLLSGTITLSGSTQKLYLSARLWHTTKDAELLSTEPVIEKDLDGNDVQVDEISYLRDTETWTLYQYDQLVPDSPDSVKVTLSTVEAQT